MRKVINTCFVSKFTMNLLFVSFMLCLLIVSPVSLGAEVYSWKDEQGRIHFSDKKTDKSKQVELKKPAIEPDEAAAQEARARIERSVQEHKQKNRDRAARDYWQKAKKKRTQAAREKKQQRCESVRYRMKRLEANWKNKRINGYQQSQQDRYRAKKRILQMDEKQYCR